MKKGLPSIKLTNLIKKKNYIDYEKYYINYEKYPV